MASKLEKFKILIPNLFTALSLVSGLFALHFIFEDNFILSAWLIAISMLCDGLDGKLARLLNAQSKFGATFDTLSDFFAFGIVPGFLAYRSLLYQIHYLGIIISVFYVFAGGYRLVRFTLKNDDTTKKHTFIGLPIPAAAGMISSYLVFNFYLLEQTGSAEILLLITFISSLLMISRIEYLPIEKGKKLSKEAKFFILLAILSIIASLKFWYFVFLIWVLIYVLYGIIRSTVFAFKKK